MKTAEVSPEIIGRRCECIFTGMLVSGTIVGITDEKFSKSVRVRFDQPQNWGGSYFKEGSNWARKHDEFGSLQFLRITDKR